MKDGYRKLFEPVRARRDSWDPVLGAGVARSLNLVRDFKPLNDITLAKQLQFLEEHG